MVARKKTWGDDGFVATVQYGAYEYSVKFVSEDKIKEFTDQKGEDVRVFGGVNCYEQTILVSADASVQTQKATLLHELVHAILLRNGTSIDEEDEKTQNVTSEALVDGMALGIYEIIRRNPELVRWIQK